MMKNETQPYELWERDQRLRAKVLRRCAEEIENAQRNRVVKPEELIAWYRAQADNLDPQTGRGAATAGSGNAAEPDRRSQQTLGSVGGRPDAEGPPCADEASRALNANMTIRVIETNEAMGLKREYVRRKRGAYMGGVYELFCELLTRLVRDTPTGWSVESRQQIELFVRDAFPEARRNELGSLLSPPDDVESPSPIRIALERILAEPHGCPMCDSGKLRNPAKPHWGNCGFRMAVAALGHAVPSDNGAV